VRVEARGGQILDEVVTRSYCIGAAHMALGWVRQEALSVDDRGDIHDLTIRSFGVLRAVDTPPIEIVLHDDESPPVAVSDAVFAAVAAAAWRSAGHVERWPTARGG
jgi:CO/xanthine dehydrogenase Mo-binding subunit